VSAALRDELRFAVGTYTRLPVPAPRTLTAAVAGRGLALGPLVGAAIGLASGLPLLGLGAEPVARLLAATLTVALAAWLTRALHWDGLADLADGLGSGTRPDRALEVMRRSDIGPFGVLALVLTLAVQVLSLALLPAGPGALAGWILAVALARLAVAAGCGTWVRPASAGGLGSLVIGSVTPRRMLAAAGLAAIVAAVQVAGGHLTWAVAMLVAPGAAIATALAVSRTAARRIGGSTGDVLGATAELAAAAALLALALS
jgi:adenosylcobinamide-GDP ribazoletransferase